MNREYHKWFSPSLNREMELLVFGHAGARAVVFPTREGRFYDYEDWRLVAALDGPLRDGRLQLFCVDSVDAEALYSKTAHPLSKLARHQRYERYILDEVVPMVRARDGASPMIAHGCSMGAYHAVNIALRHPHVFDRVLGLSGRYDLSQNLGPFADLFDGYYNEDVYFHTPNHYLPNLHDPETLDRMRRMELRLVVGAADPFFGSNLDLSRALSAKAIPNHLAVWDGEAHRACHWRKMVQQYLAPAALARCAGA